MTKRYFSLALLAAGCAGGAPKQAPPQNDSTALLLRLTPECPKSAATPEPDGPLRVFVEMIEIDAPTERLRQVGSIEDLAADPTAKIASKHMLAQDGERAELGGTAVTPRVDKASSWITLDVAMDAPPAHTTVAVADEQRIILGRLEQDGRSRITILVPTIVRSQADLQHLYECKKAHARLADQRTNVLMRNRGE
jgi:hypothetical protein